MLIISLTYSLCIYWIYRRTIKISENHLSTALDLCLIVMISGLIGSRLLHVIYEEPQYYLQNPLDIIKLWQGGFVYFGGFIAAVMFSSFYLHHKNLKFGPWGDIFAPVAAFGYAMGRLGCLLSGCCFGRECSLPWAIEFHGIGLPSGLRHPTQLYASLWELGTFTLLVWLERRKFFFISKPGTLFLIWLAIHGLGRIFMEYFREDFRGPTIIGLSISTLISGALVIIPGIILIRQWHIYKSKSA